MCVCVWGAGWRWRRGEGAWRGGGGVRDFECLGSAVQGNGECGG